jgi:Antidote-toxin recognition MazE, bacterial antitoxin
MRIKKGSATILVPTGKKVIAHDVISIRPARSGDNSPMIITIPKKIVEAMKLKKGEDLRIYTDGEKIYIDRFELEGSI